MCYMLDTWNPVRSSYKQRPVATWRYHTYQGNFTFAGACSMDSMGVIALVMWSRYANSGFHLL